jgi:membrane protease YdiL (CAAX protease family)
MWNALAYAATAGAAIVSLVGLYLFVPALRNRLLPLHRLRPLTWTGREVLLAFCIFFGFPRLVVMLLFWLGFFTPLLGLPPDLKPPSPALNFYLSRCAVNSSPLTLTLTLGILFALLFIMTGSRPHHFGLTCSRWSANVALGMLGFIVATPIVLGLFALLSLGTSHKPHQLEMLGLTDPPWWEWTLIGFQAIVAAPLLEELLFRGLLQSWLRRASLTGHVVLLTVTCFLVARDLAQDDTTTGVWELNEQKILLSFYVLALVGGYGYWMYRLKRSFDLHDTEVQRWQPQESVLPLDGSASLTHEQASESRRQIREQDEQRLRLWTEANARLAIYGSAMLFAVIHSAWPAPVPLFLLGLVLAWLKHRTQSLVGPITLHALFNLVAFIALYGSLATAPPQNGNAQTTPLRPSLVGSITTSVPASQLPLRK